MRGSLRWLAAGVVVGVVATGATRNARANCRRPTICGECPVFSGCELPKAAGFRREEGQPDSGRGDEK